MLDLESGKTLGDLMLDLAREVGLVSYGPAGDAVGTLPADEEHLERLRAAINDGYKLFIRSDRGWTFAEQPIEITLDPDGSGPHNIDGDSARYRLPHPIRSRPLHGWTLLDAGVSCVRVADRPSHVIDTWRQRSRCTGYPRYSACRALPTPGLGRESSAWEVLFYPWPDGPYTLRSEFRVVPYDLVALDERHVGGAEHDHAIFSAALMLWRRRDGEADEKAEAAAQWVAALEASRSIDRGRRPRIVGRLGDGTDHAPSPMRRGLVTHYNGIPIN